jgi:asparagine synthase (glutamine-hydrolysing)
MCGITGIIDPRGVSAQRMESLCTTLMHRGPDDSGYHVAGPIGVGMTRLAIIDVKGGHQPMFSEDKSVCIVFNGEIYNFQDLRNLLDGKYRFTTHSDTEVILHGYEEWGTDVFSKLNGIFAIALLDNRKTAKLLLARDPVGVKPLYYYASPHLFAFSSEIKTFTQLRIASKVCLPSIHQFLCSGYVFHPQTAIEGVLQVDPGCFLRVDPRGHATQESYRLVPKLTTEDRSKSPRDWVHEIKEALRRAIVRQTVSDVPLGLLLSSGLDSMFILAALRDTPAWDQLKTFTAYYDDETFSEHRPVGQVAAKWNISNEAVKLTPELIMDEFDAMCFSLDNLEFLPTGIAMYHLSKVAGRERKVVFSGNGGDELFYGYPTHRATRILRRLGPLAQCAGSLIRMLHAALPYSDSYLTFNEKLERFSYGCRHPPPLAHMLWRKIFEFEELKALLRTSFHPDALEAVMKPQTHYFDEALRHGFVEEDCFMFQDFKTWLMDYNLLLWDKTGMANSLEIRVPFLDLDFVDFLMRVPRQLRSRNPGSKWLFREISSSILPPEITALPKHGFQVPVSQWLSGPHAGRFKEYTRALPAEVFDHSMIEKLWRDHAERRRNNGLQLWLLSCLASWSRQHGAAWN